MTTLVVGYNGFLGNAVAREAITLGHRVFGVSRSTAPSHIPKSGCFVYCAQERQDTDAIAHLIREHKIDVVIDVIPMTEAGTRPLLECLAKLEVHYVMISSGDVYANYARILGIEEEVVQTSPIDEASVLRKTRFPYRKSTLRQADAADRYLDDYDKIPIEESVQKLLTNWTILRLPMVYGPGDAQGRFDWAIGPMLANVPRLHLPVAWLDWVTTYGYVDDVARAIAMAAGDRRALKRVFNVGELAPAAHSIWVERIAETVGWQGRLIPEVVPDEAWQERIAKLDLSVQLSLSTQSIRSKLAYSESIDVRQALEMTVADYRLRHGG